MPVDDPVLFWLVVAVMVVGTFGSIIPGVPGGWMIFLAALIYAFLTEFEVIGWIPLTIIGSIALVATIGDVFVAGYGARRFGASRAGTLGGILGGVIGAVIGSAAFGVGAIVGLPIGAVVGVYLAESRNATRRAKTGIPGERTVRQSVKGVFAGYLVSALAEMALGVISTLIFVFTAWPA